MVIQIVRLPNIKVVVSIPCFVLFVQRMTLMPIVYLLIVVRWDLFFLVVPSCTTSFFYIHDVVSWEHDDCCICTNYCCDNFSCSTDMLVMLVLCLQVAHGNKSDEENVLMLLKIPQMFDHHNLW